MLFISNIRHYSTCAIPTIDRDTHLRTGEPVERGTNCHFYPFGIPVWAVEEAVKSIGTPRGMGHDENPHFNFSMYDTDEAARLQNWHDENRWGKDRKARVEEALLNGMSYGTSYVAVSKPRLPAPWPTYDKIKAGGRGNTLESVAEKIASTVAELGLDVDDVVAYESENENRPEVIAALRALQVPEPEPEELVTA